MSLNNKFHIIITIVCNSDGRFDTKVLDTSIPCQKFLVLSNVQVSTPITTPLF